MRRAKYLAPLRLLRRLAVETGLKRSASVLLSAALAFVAAPPARAAVAALTWTRLPGTASSVTVATDGTLFALSTAPAGPDKSILHYVASRWTTVPGLTAQSITAGPAGTLYAANSTGGVFAYDGTTWKSLGGAGLDGLTTGADGSIYALGALADKGGDRVVWRKLGTGPWTRQTTTGVLLAGSFDPATYAVAGVGAVKPGGYFVLKSTGAISYSLPSGSSVRFSGAASDIVPVTGGFYALRYPTVASGAHLISFDYATGHATTEPELGRSLAAGHAEDGPWTQLYVVTASGEVYTTPLTFSVTPKITEFPLTTSAAYPGGIADGSDGALWFTEVATATIGRITTAGQITEHHILPPAKDYPYTAWFIAAGADGALWYTTEFGGLVGRITTAGAITEFPVNKRSSEPTGIAAGPDGAMWFTDPFFDPAIGRITSGGTISLSALSAATSCCQGSIARGPDGAMWIASAKGKIARITTGFKYSEFTIVPKTSHPVDPTTIVAGPDGALWFTEDNGNHIGRITTAGSSTEYAVPTPSAGPNALAAGPDGALWFEETNARKFGRITTSGAFTEYALPKGFGGAAGIVTGPDGALWFTDPISNAIGRITLY
jgi:streptogramin lyase